jgi:hypothetical protein
MAEETVDFKLYRYNPSMAAAVIFIILFFLITALHFYQMMRTRTWIFIPFVIGGVCKLHPFSVSAMERLANNLSQSRSSGISGYVREIVACKGQQKLTCVFYREPFPPKSRPIGPLLSTHSRLSSFWLRPPCSRQAST